MTNGHTPVSNVLEEPGEVVTEAQISQPSQGEASGEVQEEREGVESVAGYERTKAALERRFTAPDTSTLRPIAEASFGPPPPLAEIVHGPDDRVQISNTAIYPWRAHASLLITAADNSLWIGTGWFIGPHTLMTAGHVVFINGSGVPGRDGWVRSIQVMPGRNGSSLPYGSVTSTNFRSVTG